MVGGAGVVATAVPFVRSLEPSERARALGAPVEVDVRGIGSGELLTWNGAANRCGSFDAPAMLQSLQADPGLLADPASKRSGQPAAARNPWRSQYFAASSPNGSS